MLRRKCCAKKVAPRGRDTQYLSGSDTRKILCVTREPIRLSGPVSTPPLAPATDTVGQLKSKGDGAIPMSKSLVRIVAILAVAVALVLPAAAKSNTKSLNISAPISIAGTQLPAGDYKLNIDGDTITIEKGNKVMATVTGTWDDRKHKPAATGYLTQQDQIQEIYIQGDTRVFVVGSK